MLWCRSKVFHRLKEGIMPPLSAQERHVLMKVTSGYNKVHVYVTRMEYLLRSFPFVIAQWDTSPSPARKNVAHRWTQSTEHRILASRRIRVEEGKQHRSVGATFTSCRQPLRRMNTTFVSFLQGLPFPSGEKQLPHGVRRHNSFKSPNEACVKCLQSNHRTSISI